MALLWIVGACVNVALAEQGVHVEAEKSFLVDRQSDVSKTKSQKRELLNVYAMDILFAEVTNNASLLKNYSDACTAILEEASKLEICDLPEATQMPFYMQAMQSTVSVLLNHFAFSKTDPHKPASKFNHVMSMAVASSFASRVYQDASIAPVAFMTAVLICLVGALVCVVVFCRSLTPITNYKPPDSSEDLSFDDICAEHRVHLPFSLFDFLRTLGSDGG